MVAEIRNVRIAPAAGLLLASVALTAAAAPNHVLTQDQEPLFRQVMMAAEHGELGTDVNDANVIIEGAQVRIELRSASGPAGSFTLLPVSGPRSGVQPRFFDLHEEEPAHPGHRERLVAVLDSVFHHDPWLSVVEQREYAEVNSSRPLLGSWRRDGLAGFFIALGERPFMNHTGRAAFIVTSLLVALALLLSLWALLRARPDN